MVPLATWDSAQEWRQILKNGNTPKQNAAHFRIPEGCTMRSDLLLRGCWPSKPVMGQWYEIPPAADAVGWVSAWKACLNSKILRKTISNMQSMCTACPARRELPLGTYAGCDRPYRTDLPCHGSYQATKRVHASQASIASRHTQLGNAELLYCGIATSSFASFAA